MAKKKGNALSESSGAIAPAKPIHDDPVDNYEVKGHLQTLMDAHNIMRDPDKMDKVRKLAGRHAKAIAGIKEMAPIQPKKPVRSVDDIKQAYQKLATPQGIGGDEDGDE